MPFCAPHHCQVPLAEARSHGRTVYKRSKSLTAILAIRLLTCYFS